MPAPVGPSFAAKAMLAAGRVVHQPFEVPADMTKSAVTSGGATHEFVGGLNKSIVEGLQALQPIGPLAKLIDGFGGRVSKSLDTNASQAQKATELFWGPFSNGAHQTGFSVSNPFASFYAKRAGFETPADPAAAQEMLAGIVDSKGWPEPKPAEDLAATQSTPSPADADAQPAVDARATKGGEVAPPPAEEPRVDPKVEHSDGAAPTAHAADEVSIPSTGAPRAPEAGKLEVTPEIKASLERFTQLPADQRAQLIQQRTSELQRAAADTTLTAEQRQELGMAQAELELFSSASADAGAGATSDAGAKPTSEANPAVAPTE